MKARADILGSGFALGIAVSWLCAGSALFAAGFSIAPPSVTNDYSGKITFLITNVTSGATVRLEEFLDLNNNGAVESTDLLVNSFQITDGQAVGFGGVRDPGIPGDEDTVGGRITVSLNYLDKVEVSRVSGNHLFRLSSPTSAFGSVVVPFLVRQPAYGQSVSGVVTSGASALSQAFVGLASSAGDFVAAVLTDATGHYSLKAAPGTYGLFCLKSGYAAPFGEPVVTINSSQVATQNLAMATGTRTISGRISDAKTGAGLPAIQLFVQSTTTNTGCVVSSDATANFSLSVPPDQYKLNLSDKNLQQLGYLRPATKPKVNVTSGNVTGLNLALTRATAMIYGTLKTDANVPLAGISIFAGDAASLYDSTALTDTNGNYAIAVLGGTNWFIGPDNSSPGLQGYSVNSTNLFLAANQAVRVDFTALPPVQLTFAFRHFTYGGDFGNDFTPVTPFPISIRGYLVSLLARNDPAFPPPNNVIFTGPPGSGLANTPADRFSTGAGFENYFSPNVFNPATAPGGAWTIWYNGNVTNLSVPDPQAASRLFAPVPTVTVSGGNLTDISWALKDSNGNALANAPAYVTKFQVNIFDPDLNLLDSSASMPPTARQYTLSAPIPWSAVGRVQTIYVDTLTNRYLLNCNRATPSLALASRPNSQFQFQASGLAGQNYTVQYSTTLTNWFTLYLTNAPVGSFRVLDPSATDPQRFYRIFVSE